MFLFAGDGASYGPLQQDKVQNKRLGIVSSKLDLDVTALLPRLGCIYRIEDGKGVKAIDIE